MLKTSEKATYFHGTCSKFSKKILKKGFIPNPKEKMWANGRLESFTGTYLTTNFMTAYSAAGNAMRKFGDNRVIFEVQVETKEGIMDEDELPGMFQFLQRACGHLLPQGFVKRMFKKEEYSEKEVNDDYVVPAAKLWLESFLKRRKKEKQEMSKELKEKLIQALGVYALATLKDIAEHGDESETGSKEIAELRKAKEKVLSILKGELAKRDIFDTFGNNNIRIPDPITFKGANKILSAIEIKEFEEKPSILVPLYGEPSSTFLKGYEGHITDKFEVKKSSIINKVLSKLNVGANMKKESIVKKVIALLRKRAIEREDSKQIAEDLKKINDANKRNEQLQKIVNERSMNKEEVSELMYDLNYKYQMLNLKKPQK